jgi:hypothetical protein
MIDKVLSSGYTSKTRLGTLDIKAYQAIHNKAKTPDLGMRSRLNLFYKTLNDGRANFIPVVSPN